MIKLTSEINTLRLSTENRQKKYYTKQEIIDNFARSIFESKETKNIEDQWKRINSFRAFVRPSLNQGLSDVLKLYAKANLPIIEIGAGIGYNIDLQFPSPIIKTQMRQEECQLFSTVNSDPIYQLTIENIVNALQENKKNVSLFFGLNVFDTMSEKEREKNLLNLSALQKNGDQILILSDTNPTFGVIVNDIEEDYPDFYAIPILPLDQGSHRLECLLVPKEMMEKKYSENELVEMLEQDCLLLSKGYLSLRQTNLHSLKKQLNLKVIDLEDFYIKKTQSILEEIGYSSVVYRHTSFVTAPLESKALAVNQDLIYKAITDTATVRQWSLNDQKLINDLIQKNITLPNIDVEELRKNKVKVLGAEILVIASTKK